MIKIIDDIMGSGKTTWAINYINQNQDKKFLCVLPTLSECERYRNNTESEMINPEVWGTKLNHFRKLIDNNKNIATTHALILKMDLETLELLKSKDYILIIDECLDVLSQYKISKHDTDILFNENLVSFDEERFLIWNDCKSDYKGRFDEIRRLCELRSLIGLYNSSYELLMWNFPVNFFKCFSESYIFTYLWEGSIQKSYFDLHKVEYSKFMLNKNKQLISYSKELELKKRKKYASLIDIYEGKFNKIGERLEGTKSNPLSKSWYSNPQNDLLLNQLKNNTENYFRSNTHTNASDNMFTVHKSFKKIIKGKGYARSFVPCNARGTNDYRNKKALAYLLNFYINPCLKNFMTDRGIKFDEDKFALSNLLQWIWRSQIRDNKPIQIYIPSYRMRGLLQEWIAES